MGHGPLLIHNQHDYDNPIYYRNFNYSISYSINVVIKYFKYIPRVSKF